MNKKNTAKPDLNITILSQYIKDLSFENFNIINNGFPTTEPVYKIDINVKITPKNKNIYEVSINLLANAASDETKVYILELDYAGLFSFNIENETYLNEVLMVECPKILFPFLRRIAADITRDGGYSPLSLQIIDFKKIFNDKNSSDNR